MKNAFTNKLVTIASAFWLTVSCLAFDFTYSDDPENLVSTDFFTQQLSWRNPALLWGSGGESSSFTVQDKTLILKARKNGRRTLASINLDIGYETAQEFDLSLEYCSTGNELIFFWWNQNKLLPNNELKFALPATAGKWQSFSKRLSRIPEAYEVELRFKAARRNGELKVRNVRLKPVEIQPRGAVELAGEKVDAIYYEKEGFYAWYAAKILRSQLWRVKNVVLKMSASAPGATGIVIGGRAPQAKRGGYELTVTPGKALVRGNLPGGYELGVVALLQKLGIEYFTPYDYTIPERLSCAACKQAVSPGVALRRSGIFDRMRELVNYSAPMYWSDDKKINCGYHGYAHTGPSYLPYNEFHPTHPEYFALQADGKRLRRIPGKPFQTHFCMSNAEARNIIASRMIELMRCEPHALVFNLDPGDGAGRYCRCENCQKMSLNRGERNLMWANDIARQVAKVFPNRLISTSAYVDSRFPPDRVVPAPNVNVKYCIYEPSWPSHLIFNHPDNVEGMAELRGWEKRCPQNLSAISYCNILGEYLNISPSFYANYAQMKNFSQNRLFEVYFYGLNRTRGRGTTPANNSFIALALKIFGEVLVDPELGVEKEIDRFMAFYYGPAAPMMRQYFDIIHKEVRDRDWVQNAEHRRRGFVTKTLADKCYRCFDAAAKVATGDYRPRVEIEKLRILWSDLSDNNRGNGKITHDELPRYAARLAEFCSLCKRHGKIWNTVSYDRWFLETAMLKLGNRGIWYDDPVIVRLMKDPLDTLSKMIPDVQKATPYGWHIPNAGLLGGERSKSSWLMAEPRWTTTLRRPSSGLGTVRFNLKLTEVPAGGVTLKVWGVDNEKKNPALMALQVNGRTVYSGAVPWSKEEWQESCFEVPATLLKTRQNEVVFFNTTPDTEKDELCGANFIAKRNYFWGWYSIRDVRIIKNKGMPSGDTLRENHKKEKKMSVKPVEVIVSDKVIGKIKKLNGGNLAPPLADEMAGCNIRKSFAELNVPITRLHDAPIENCSLQLVDVPKIFPLFHADEGDPRNYYFEQTDDYIYNCLELGTHILYRLGTTIEHTRKKYFIYPPEDTDKWIEICSNIIRHYTEGWARGYYYQWLVRHWEIWCEPDCGDGKGHLLLWQGSIDEYNQFYVKVARELKKRFPVLRFGGPGHISPEENTENFIKYCAQHKAPLDFYSYHVYADDPRSPRLIESPAKIRAILDENGYKNTEIFMDEWHYISGGGTRMWTDYQYRREVYAEMKSLNAAAFHNEVLTRWQDTPLDMGCLYTLTTGNYGLYEYRSNVPTKAYYGMKAFGEIVRYEQRLKATSSNKDVVALAGIDNDGKKALLISGFKVGPQSLRVSGLSPESKIRVVDDKRNLEPIEATVKNGKLEFKCESESIVVLITE